MSLFFKYAAEKNKVSIRKVKDLSYFSKVKEELKDKELDWVTLSHQYTNKYFILFGREIAGFITSKQVEPHQSSFSVYLLPDFRGKGIAAKAEKLLVMREKLTRLIAVINKHNTNSLKAHKKAGFKYDSSTVALRKSKDMPKRHTQYIKDFQKAAAKKIGRDKIRRAIKVISDNKPHPEFLEMPMSVGVNSNQSIGEER